MMLSLPQRNVLILAIAALAAIASPSVAMTPAEVAEIYKKYDVDEENTPECLEAHEDFLCPKDQNIPCSDIKLIEEWCSNAIGADEVAASKGVGKGSGKNALEGCVKYIGFHVLDLDHMACCEVRYLHDFYIFIHCFLLFSYFSSTF